MELNVVNRSGFELPKFETGGAAGVDLKASKTIVLAGESATLVPTGIFVAIPAGYELQIRPRSGLSLKTPLRVANAPGTIDSDYRGEIKVIIDNISHEDFVINAGDRIAQMVLCPVFQFDWSEKGTVEDLGDTIRGEGGFGSTGQ